MKPTSNSELKFWFWPFVFVFLSLDADLVPCRDGETWHEEQDQTSGGPRPLKWQVFPNVEDQEEIYSVGWQITRAWKLW